MAARKRHRGRRGRGRFGFLYVVLSFLLIVASLVVGSVVFFRANTITVNGNSRYTAEEIIAAAQIEPEQNLFRINRPHTYQKIFDALPYIRDVNIRRAFPDELVITVTETRAVASLTCAEGCFLLDPRAKVVEKVSTPPAHLPEVSGLTPEAPVIGTVLPVPPLYQPRLDALAGLLTALDEAASLGDLKYVDLSSSSVLTFGFTQRFVVQMPVSCDYPYKINAMNYVISQLASNESGTIDMTREDEVHVIPPTDTP